MFAVTSGRVLQRLRRERGLSQRALARKAAVSQPAISALENDEMPLGWRRAQRLARALGVHPYDLFRPKEAQSWQERQKTLSKEHGKEAGSPATPSSNLWTMISGPVRALARNSRRRSGSPTTPGLSGPILSPPTNLKQLLEELNRHRVRYLVVGGYVVGVYAKPRATKDLDLWLQYDAENLARACAALEQFTIPPQVVDYLRTATPTEIVWFGKPPERFDILFSMDGVHDFEHAWQRRVIASFDGIPTPVLGREDLLANKRAVHRPQDRRDVQAIEREMKRVENLRRRRT
jgi:transcriptional regulator with XRE-family HTH domain